MDERSLETAVELTIKLTNQEVSLRRLAIFRATTEPDLNKAARLFFGSLRARHCRFLIGRSDGIITPESDGVDPAKISAIHKPV